MIKSNKLNVSVINKCSGSLDFYRDTTKIIKEIFDCNFEKVVRMQLESGNYRVVATSFGQSKTQDFVKSDFEQNLIIEF
jgi:hypothetical protein